MQLKIIIFIYKNLEQIHFKIGASSQFVKQILPKILFKLNESFEKDFYTPFVGS